MFIFVSRIIVHTNKRFIRPPAVWGTMPAEWWKILEKPKIRRTKCEDDELWILNEKNWRQRRRPHGMMSKIGTALSVGCSNNSNTTALRPVTYCYHQHEVTQNNFKFLFMTRKFGIIPPHFVSPLDRIFNMVLFYNRTWNCWISFFMLTSSVF